VDDDAEIGASAIDGGVHILERRDVAFEVFDRERFGADSSELAEQAALPAHVLDFGSHLRKASRCGAGLQHPIAERAELRVVHLHARLVRFRNARAARDHDAAARSVRQIPGQRQANPARATRQEHHVRRGERGRVGTCFLVAGDKAVADAVAVSNLEVPGLVQLAGDQLWCIGHRIGRKIQDAHVAVRDLAGKRLCQPGPDAAKRLRHLPAPEPHGAVHLRDGQVEQPTGIAFLRPLVVIRPQNCQGSLHRRFPWGLAQQRQRALDVQIDDGIGAADRRKDVGTAVRLPVIRRDRGTLETESPHYGLGHPEAAADDDDPSAGQSRVRQRQHRRHL
jgi:hypothetical protein